MNLIQLLVVLLVAGLAIYLVDLLPIGPPWKLAIRAVVVVIVIVWLLQAVGLLSGLGTVRVE